MNKIIKNRIYKHFKGDYYLVLDIAKNADTLEEYVIYEALYGNGDIWVRPLSSFVEEVDRQKYPNVSQKYKFTIQKVDSQRNNFTKNKNIKL